MSTLDLPELCRGGSGTALLLILGAQSRAQPWAEAAAQLSGSLPLAVCHIVAAGEASGGGSTPESSSSDNSGGSSSSGSSAPGDAGPGPRMPTFVDADGQWQRLREVAEEGAILVRPDGHVAWRSRGGGAAEECAQRLRAAVQHVMCL